MRIPVDTIPRPGRQVKLLLGEEWVRQAAVAALEAEPRSLTGHLDVSPPGAKRMVTVRSDLSLSAEVVCARCGETIDFRLTTQAPLSYLPPPEVQSGEVELEEEDLELGWYSDEEIDLSTVLRELIALAAPARYTCVDAEGCDARTDALLAAASDTVPSGHPGFAVLKKLKN